MAENGEKLEIETMYQRWYECVWVLTFSPCQPIYLSQSLSITENEFAVLHSMTSVDFQFKLL